MSYGIQNRRTKKWVEVTTMDDEGFPRCRLIDRKVGGVWFNKLSDAKQYMESHKLPEDQYRVYSYRLDQYEWWFDENKDVLTKAGYSKKGTTIYRPDGTRLK